MEFLKAVAALTGVFYATAIIGCLGSDLCYDLGTEAWWATIGRMAVYSPLVSFVIVLSVVMVGEIAEAIGEWRWRREEIRGGDDESEGHHRI
jgi:hypothetical protein